MMAQRYDSYLLVSIAEAKIFSQLIKAGSSTPQRQPAGCGCDFRENKKDPDWGHSMESLTPRGTTPNWGQI